MLSQKQKRTLIAGTLVATPVLSILTPAIRAKVAMELAEEIATALEEADPSNDPQQTI